MNLENVSEDRLDAQFLRRIQRPVGVVQELPAQGNQVCASRAQDVLCLIRVVNHTTVMVTTLRYRTDDYPDDARGDTVCPFTAVGAISVDMIPEGLGAFFEREIEI